jgi:LmbE family N-acetylglucosaminyl deacetylase
MNQRNGRGVNGSAWARLGDPEFGLLSKSAPHSFRVLLLAAHPDDETIGASAFLGRLPNTTVVYLTDGAPRDRQLWSAGGNHTREEYARIRRKEAETALRLLGILPGRIQYLGAIDQESVFQLHDLTEALLDLLYKQQPDILITHSYEGGHPDHDSAALVASLAIQSCESRRATAPELLEMTSYHARGGKCFMGEFLPESAAQASSSPELILQLSPEESARKQCMMNCYQSQQRVLQNFQVRSEHLRLAPAYDFTKPPHPGKLWYECMGWPTTGKQWRALATQAVAASADARTSPGSIPDLIREGTCR